MLKAAALLIFIKNPQLGHVKTRLAKSLGDVKALQIYQALLQHTRQITRQIDATRYLYYSQFIDQQDDWPAAQFHKSLQQKGNLGAKMKHAFEEALEKHERVIIIGSDCASLTAELLRQAFEQLKTHDFVIGPAMDGGYYLLGMQQLSVQLFDSIPWSTEEVLNSTLQRVQQAGKNYFLLPELSDIDYEADWLKYGWQL